MGNTRVGWRPLTPWEHELQPQHLHHRCWGSELMGLKQRAKMPLTMWWSGAGGPVPVPACCTEQETLQGFPGEGVEQGE